MRISGMASTLGAGICACASAASAGTSVTVTVTGEVEFNGIRNSPIDRNNVPAGSAVVLTFGLDAGEYLDSSLHPVRGYVIDQSSFVLTLNGVPVGLQSPYP